MIEKEKLIKLKSTINCRGKIIDLSQPKIMGILNVTPDSFYDGGYYNHVKEMLDHVDKMIAEGADFIDIGAQSTRPNARMLTAEEEMERLKPVLTKLKKEFPEQFISLDTYHAAVAKMALADFEVDIINDVSAGELDRNMMQVIADHQVPFIMMHMRGNPQNMQKQTDYNDIVVDILNYFAPKIETAKRLGINDVVIDPGFGFSKTMEQNYTLLNRLDELSVAGLPVIVGLSRKSMIYKKLDLTPDLALNGTTALHAVALMKGTQILRVHDVKEAKEVVELIKMLAN